MLLSSSNDDHLAKCRLKYLSEKKCLPHNLLDNSFSIKWIFQHQVHSQCSELQWLPFSPVFWGLLDANARNHQSMKRRMACETRINLIVDANPNPWPLHFLMGIALDLQLLHVKRRGRAPVSIAVAAGVSTTSTTFPWIGSYSHFSARWLCFSCKAVDSWICRTYNIYYFFNSFIVYVLFIY